jgi:uncharacterized membrane protein
LAELGWSENRWQQEENDYQTLWANSYSLPSKETIPDWKSNVQEAINKQKSVVLNRRRKMKRRSIFTVILLIFSISLIMLFWKKTRQPK